MLSVILLSFLTGGTVLLSENLTTEPSPCQLRPCGAPSIFISSVSDYFQLLMRSGGHPPRVFHKVLIFRIAGVILAAAIVGVSFLYNNKR